MASSSRRGTTFAPLDPDKKPAHERQQPRASTSKQQSPPVRKNNLAGPLAGGRIHNDWGPERKSSPASQRAAHTSNRTAGLSSTVAPKGQAPNGQYKSATLVFSNQGDHADARFMHQPGPSRRNPRSPFAPGTFDDEGARTRNQQPPRTQPSHPRASSAQLSSPSHQPAASLPTAKAILNTIDISSSDEESAKVDKGKRRAQPGPVAAGEQTEDPIENDSDADELDMLPPQPRKFDFTGQTPSAHPFKPLSLEAARGQKPTRTGDFDSPPQAKPPPLNHPKEKRTAKMKPRAGSNPTPNPNQLGFTADPGNFDDLTDEFSLTSKLSKQKPKPREGPTAAPPIDLPIKPYSLTRDHLFSPTHARSTHRLLMHTAGSVKTRKVVLQRKKNPSGQYEPVLEFGQADLAGVTTFPSAPVLCFRFNRHQPASFFDKLMIGYGINSSHWLMLEEAERVLTVVLDDETKLSPLDELVSAIKLWHEQAKFAVSETTGAGGQHCMQLFTSRLDEALGGEQPTTRAPPPPAPRRPVPDDSNLAVRDKPSSASEARERLNQPAKPNFTYSYDDSLSARKTTRSQTKHDDDLKRKEKDREQPKPAKLPKEVDLTPPGTLRLVWPYSNGMHVTHGDIKRLDPDEFLNDTLIELGLSFIVDEHNAARPGEPSDVHVFNPFFYKMLTQRRPYNNPDFDPYSSVRKWTAKFDLFSKKFVVIPINESLHWYLAVILNPAAVAKEGPPPPEPPATRSRRSSLENDEPEKNAELAQELFGSSPEPTAKDAPTPVAGSPPATAEPSARGSMEGGGPSDMMVDEARTEDKMEGIEPTTRPEAAARDQSSPTAHSAEQQTGAPTVTVLVPDSDPQPNSQPQPAALPATLSRKPTPTTFGPSATPPGEKPKPPTTDSLAKEVSQINLDKPTLADQPADGPVRAEPEVDDTVVFDESKCYIYIFDSLRSSHRGAANKLTQYLVSEARDKKSIQHPDAGAVVPLEVIVPQQSNLSDCGLYVLHYVRKLLLEWDTIRPFIHGHHGSASLLKGGKNARTRYGTDEVGKAWDQDVASGFRGEFRKQVIAKAKGWEEDEKPKLDAREAEAREREEKRRAAKSVKADEELKAKQSTQESESETHDDANSSVELAGQQRRLSVEPAARSTADDKAVDAHKRKLREKAPLRVPKNSARASRGKAANLGTVVLSSDESSDDGDGSDFHPQRNRTSPPSKERDTLPKPSPAEMRDEHPTVSPDQAEAAQVEQQTEPAAPAPVPALDDSPDPGPASPPKHRKRKAHSRKQPEHVDTSGNKIILDLTAESKPEPDTDVRGSPSPDSDEQVAEQLHKGSSQSPQQRKRPRPEERKPNQASVPVVAVNAGVGPFSLSQRSPKRTSTPRSAEDITILASRPPAQADAARAASQRAQSQSQSAKSDEPSEEQRPSKKKKLSPESSVPATEPSPPPRRSVRQAAKPGIELIDMTVDDSQSQSQHTQRSA